MIYVKRTHAADRKYAKAKAMAIEVVLLAEMKLNLTVSLGSKFFGWHKRTVGQGVELHL